MKAENDTFSKISEDESTNTKGLISNGAAPSKAYVEMMLVDSVKKLRLQERPSSPGPVAIDHTESLNRIHTPTPRRPPNTAVDAEFAANLSSPLFKGVANHKPGSKHHSDPLPGGDRVLRPKKKVAVKPRTNTRIITRHSVLGEQMLESSQRLSSTVRVQKPARTKRLSDIRRDSARFHNLALPPTPTSALQTPVELHEAQPFLGASTSDFDPPSPLSVFKEGAFFPVTPVENDLASLAIIADLVETQLPLPKAQEQKDAMTQALRLRSGSVLTVIPPEQTAWQRSVYVPGSIRLQHPYSNALNFSVVSLDVWGNPIDEASGSSMYSQRTGRSSSRRSSEASLRDDLMDWYHDYNFDPVSFTFDRYWMEGTEGGSMDSGFEHFVQWASRSNSVRGSKLAVPNWTPPNFDPPKRPLPPSPSPPMPPPKLLDTRTHVRRPSVPMGGRAPRRGRNAPPPTKIKFKRLVMSATSII